jgi:tousled-like kinase
VEVWIDGFAFQDLTQQQASIISQKEELEKQRKLLGKRKPLATTGKSTRGGKQSPTQLDGEGFTKPQQLSLTLLEFAERDEILKLRGTALKKEESNLSQVKEKLERERNLHIRELKRIAAEDNSRSNIYNNYRE